jgi:hypothetical protein
MKNAEKCDDDTLKKAVMNYNGNNEMDGTRPHKEWYQMSVWGLHTTGRMVSPTRRTEKSPSFKAWR